MNHKQWAAHSQLQQAVREVEAGLADLVSIRYDSKTVLGTKHALRCTAVLLPCAAPWPQAANRASAEGSPAPSAIACIMASASGMWGEDCTTMTAAFHNVQICSQAQNGLVSSLNMPAVPCITCCLMIPGAGKAGLLWLSKAQCSNGRLPETPELRYLMGTRGQRSRNPAAANICSTLWPSSRRRNI